MSRPRISLARSAASSGVAASLMPPALPRPPTSTWALTTTGPPISAAAARASSGVSATRPSETGMPKRANSCFPWYSYRSTRRRLAARAHGDRHVQRARVRQRERRGILGVLRLLEVGRRDLEAVPPGAQIALVDAGVAVARDRDALLRPVDADDDVGRAHAAAGVGDVEAQRARPAR